MMKKENLTIPEYFNQAAEEFADKVCLQIKKGPSWERLTYKEVKDYSLTIAAFLIKEGFKKDDFAALILENRPEWGIIYLGIMSAGLTCVPLNPQLSGQEIQNFIQDSQAKIIFCSYGLFADKIKEVSKESKILVVVLDAKEEQNKGFIDFSALKNVTTDNIVWPEVNPCDIASLIYTSGTTGKSKGILLSHKNFCSNFISIRKLNLCFPSDNFLSILPLYHVFSFMGTLIAPLCLGAKVTYCASFKSEEFSQIIKEAEVTILAGVPQLFSLLHKAIFDKIKKIPSALRPLVLPFIKMKIHRKFGSLRFSISGGARLEPKIGKDLTGLGLKIIEGYGLTETSPVVTINVPERIKFGSVGKSVPDVEIKIFNPDEKGVGEVLIKGPNVMQGYFRQPQLTLETIKDGWFYSGDLGYIDKEGYLYLVGREKEVIVLASGKNIYPQELEEYYLKSPYIKEICITHKQEKVFGYLKDSLFAVIVPDLQYFNQRKEVNIREKIRWELETLGTKLAPYQHIMGFIVTKEELPRTALKKVKRFAVRQRYLSQEAAEAEIVVLTDEDKKILEKEIAQRIIHYIAKEVNRSVNLYSHFEIDLGIDSLTRVELGLGLEALFKIKIPDELLYKLSTVKDTIINLENLIKGTGSKTQEAADQKAALDNRIAKAKEKTWNEILKESPPEEIIKKIKIDFGVHERAFIWLVKNIFLFIFRLFWPLRIERGENLPKQGPYLICPNHASYLDGLFISSSLPFKRSMNTYFLGYQRIFEHPSLLWANKVCRFISVDPNSHLTEAMQAVSYVLLHKKIVCIFPEGMRSVDTQVKEFKKGVGILIKELDIPVVAVYIQGSHQSWPRGNKFPRPHPIKVIFGKPLYLKQLGNDYEAIVKGLREEVLKLIPKDAKS